MRESFCARKFLCAKVSVRESFCARKFLCAKFSVRESFCARKFLCAKVSVHECFCARKFLRAKDPAGNEKNVFITQKQLIATKLKLKKTATEWTLEYIVNAYQGEVEFPINNRTGQDCYHCSCNECMVWKRSQCC